jgi:serine/threonine protein kinase
LKFSLSSPKTIKTKQKLSNIEYRLISKKGEGTFSEVLKAQSIKTGKYVAIKCMKAHFYNID